MQLIHNSKTLLESTWSVFHQCFKMKVKNSALNINEKAEEEKKIIIIDISGQVMFQ